MAPATPCFVFLVFGFWVFRFGQVLKGSIISLMQSFNLSAKTPGRKVYFPRGTEPRKKRGFKA
jgi:hypothetical protein